MNDPIANRLFQNAIDSVELGLEDFRLAKSDPRRYVSATRNVFAGMLLLFKSWLAEESAERNYDLLRAETKEVKKLSPEDWSDISEAKTAGFGEIKDRIGAKVDWVRIDKLHDYRNRIEHAFISGGHKESDVVRCLAQSFLVIRDFMKKEIGEDPARRLSLDGWDTLFNEHDVHLQEESERNDAVDNLGWIDSNFTELVKHEFECPDCGSEIVTVNDATKEADGEKARYICRKCGKDFSYGELCAVISSRCHCSVCDDSIEPDELLIYLETGMCAWHAHIWEKELTEE